MPLKSPSPLRRLAFAVRHPFAPSGYPDAFDPALADEIRSRFSAITRSYALDAAEFRQFVRECGYAEQYVQYMGPTLLDEKLLEHYVSLKLIAPEPGDVLIDIGSAQSPFASYVARQYGCRTYQLDLAYAEGIHGDRIGAPAQEIPLEDASVAAMTLHCTIDHFEGGADSAFVREAARVLRPGGRVCILPVYFAAELSNICDPAHFAPGAELDHAARLRGVLGYNNRFGRYYSPAALDTRLLANAAGLEPTLYRIEGEKDRIENTYLNYALLLTRT